MTDSSLTTPALEPRAPLSPPLSDKPTPLHTPNAIIQESPKLDRERSLSAVSSSPSSIASVSFTLSSMTPSIPFSPFSAVARAPSSTAATAGSRSTSHSEVAAAAVEPAQSEDMKAAGSSSVDQLLSGSSQDIPDDNSEVDVPCKLFTGLARLMYIADTVMFPCSHSGRYSCAQCPCGSLQRQRGFCLAQQQRAFDVDRRACHSREHSLDQSFSVSNH